MNDTERNPLAGLIEAFDTERARIEADAETRLTADEMADVECIVCGWSLSWTSKSHDTFVAENTYCTPHRFDPDVDA